MNKIIGGRCEGKTTRLLKIAEKTGATVVGIRKDYVKDLAKKHNIQGVNIIDYGEFMSGTYIKCRTANYLIDEIDAFLSYIGVNGYTLSKKEK